MQNEVAGEATLATLTFRIEGMSCSCEAQIVEKRMRALQGIKSYSLNPITNQMKLTCDPTAVSVQDIEKAATRAGVKAVLVQSR
jgi:copper chaperone CopZ